MGCSEINACFFHNLGYSIFRLRKISCIQNEQNVFTALSNHTKTYDRLDESTLIYIFSQSPGLIILGWVIIRGLQALSVQFRFAFSKPYSSQTRFLNRPVAAPAEVAHFCRYKKFLFFDQFAF